MYNYSIMPLDTEHVEEVCQDIRYQYENGIADLVLFMMTLTPEGNPVIDKAAILCEKYDLFRDRLREMGLDCGILVQATIGHGYVLDKPNPYQRLVGMADGVVDYVCCPYDEDFRDHIFHQLATVAKHQPKLIMVDDDFRLMGGRSGQGCACPLHLTKLEERSGEHFTQETLKKRIYEEQDQRIKELFIETQLESMIGAAKVMRAGIDSVDPTIPGAFCACGNGAECAADIAKILAGEGNPSIVRVNNGNYTNPSSYGMSDAMYRAASQIQQLKDVDAVLAETDTCPQNRYSTGAYPLHTHFTATILEGASGAKHWITRMHAFEPNSGKNYRKVLGMHAAFYQALADLVPKLHWIGCRVPVASKAEYMEIDQTKNGWNYHVLERMGLPMYFAAEFENAAFLDGDADRRYTDEEILELLQGTVFLSSETAYRLVQRGYAEYLGVNVCPWKGEHPSKEIVYVNHNECPPQMGIHELIPLNDAVEIHSMVMHVPDGKTNVPIFPGVTRYTNALGGTVVVFCGTPKAKFKHNQAFSFLNESRKLQMVQLLRESGNLPVWYLEDEPVYLRAAYIGDTKELMVAFFNIGMDPLDEIPLGLDRKTITVERLLPDGTRAACNFHEQEPGIVIETEARIMDPVILFIK